MDKKRTSPFQLDANEDFSVGYTNLSDFAEREQRISDPVLLYCTKGNAIIFNNLEVYELHPFWGHIIMPDRILRLKSCSPDFEVKYITFSITLFKEVSLRIKPSFFPIIANMPPEEMKTEEERMYFTNLMTEFKYLYDRRDHPFRLQILTNTLQNIFYDIAYHLERMGGETLKATNEAVSQKHIISKFIMLIREHFRTHRDVKFYASELCITPRYLSAVTQSSIQISPKQLIDQHTILEIKVALQNELIPIQNLASEMNFPDQSSFGRYFKHHTGMSPTHYRNSR